MVDFISPFSVQGAAHERWQAEFEKATGAKLGDANFDKAIEAYTKDHPEPRATIKDVADHIEYVREVAGIDHVGIGSDFYGDPANMAEGLEDVSRYPYLFAELIRRGWMTPTSKSSRAGISSVPCAERSRSRPACGPAGRRPTRPSSRWTAARTCPTSTDAQPAASRTS
jgi:membrane dipeptidase